jgi:hypothetical protein
MAYAFPIIDRIPTAAKVVEKNLSASMKAFAVNTLANLGNIGDQKPSIMGLIRSF